MHAALPIVVALGLLLLAGCAGDGPAANTSTDWFSLLQRDVFDVNCLSAGCHNAQNQAGGLVLSPGFSYDNLVNIEPTNPAAQSAGLERVVPFDTASSFLLIKLTDPGVGEGDRMPQGAAPLSAEDLNIVTQWILAGAPPAMTQTVPVDVTATPTATATPSLPTATATAPLPTATPTATAPSIPSPTVPPDSTPTTIPPSPSPTATQLVTLADVQSQVFNPHCLTVGCHTAVAQSGSMVLEAGSSAASLINVPAVNFNASTEGLLRVVPGNPDMSFLYIKITAPTLLQGSLMPMGQAKLSDDLIALVRDWIAQGAQQ